MKNILGLLAICMSFVAVAGNGGPTKVVYDLKFESEDPEMAMAIPMLEGSSMTMEDDGKKTKSVMKMGAFQTQTTIVDKKKGDAVMLMAGMQGKIGVLMPKDSLDNGQLEVDDDATIETTDEKLTIQGYECVKKVAKDSEGNELMTMWISEKLGDADGKYEKWGGFPLKMQVVNERFTLTFTATEVSTEKTKIKEKVEIPEGYKAMTMEELRKMSMGGGM